MKKGKKTSVMTAAVIGGISVVIILLAGTIWTGKNASRDTETAVRNVSLLYLDELAERREQVVSSTLSDYIGDMDIALGLMENEDLDSEESLRAYQARMKQLYGLEKFAFVDSDGMIYTSRGTRKDIDKYNFDYNNLSEPEVSTINTDSNNKKVIVAAPVDNLLFGRKTLVACFMEIDMNHMLDGISMNADTNNNTTFCNIYTKDGIALTNVVLGGLASEDNLLSAMEHAKFENGYSIDDIKNGFSEEREGVVSFTYGGVQETMYYVPVEGADWMLTYLIRESVINDQIGSISAGIITRSLVQSILASLVLVSVFTFMIFQLRKNAKLTLEKEISETENRVRQQELEEQIAMQEEQVAMQEELLEQEKKKAEQDKMITALASDYRSVYYIDLDTDDGICYRNDHRIADDVKEGDHFSFMGKFSEYAMEYVDEAYREEFLEFIEPSSIRERLKTEIILVYRYLIHRDGKDSYEMLRMAGVRHLEDRVDHIVHAVGVGFTDIDDEMRDSLEKSQALRDALQVAEDASKAKTVFLSNMSHEIRTPMNAIIGLDSLALNDPDISDRTREYLEKIDGSAKHLLGLINDILDMSRIESGKMVIKREEFSFSKLVEQVNTIISGQCREKGLAYDCSIRGEIDDYYIGDDVKLRQVLINILGNAVKFTPEGGKVSFIVAKVAGFDGKSTLRFEMRDNGIGMSREYLPKIFETFSQEDIAVANKYGSSGLGMAITKNIVEMMNGKIEVESEKGRGTNFTVTVTLLDSDRKESVKEDDMEIIPGDISVLVIDDDEIAAEHAKLILEKVGISSEVAFSGREAVEMVKLQHARMKPYNFIVVDWQMPDMDGVETTKQIRSVVGDESAIIFLTAYNWDDILEEATAAGVDSFIAKPLFSGNLLDEFKKALKKKKITSVKENVKADLSGKRILLAEDVDINAEIMIEILNMEDMEVEHAENGEIAVNMFDSRPEGYYDAILMDMRMPKMDGLEAAKAIRAKVRKDAKTIPIIALTANAFDEDVQRSLQAGLNAHLSKPVDPDILYETLRDMIV